MLCNKPPLIYIGDGDGTDLTKCGQEPSLFCKVLDGPLMSADDLGGLEEE
jgi:hypothetical protein